MYGSNLLKLIVGMFVLITKLVNGMSILDQQNNQKISQKRANINVLLGMSVVSRTTIYRYLFYSFRVKEEAKKGFPVTQELISTEIDENIEAKLPIANAFVEIKEDYFVSK